MTHHAGSTNGARLTGAIALVAIVAGLTLAPVAMAAQTPPPPPDAYYGEVTIDGEPAPEGTVVTATIDGEVRGQITVSEPGVYATADGTSEKLVVDGTDADDGATVEFFVDGEPARTHPERVEWVSGGHQRVDLDAESADEPSIPPPPAPGEPDVRVTEAALNATQIGVGGAVEVTATLENRGEASTTHVVELSVDGKRVDGDAISLDPGETVEYTFLETFDEAGAYAIAVDETEAGTVTVGAADVRVTDAAVSETDVAVGDSVEVTATLENAGTLAGEETVELLIDGEPVDSTTVDVAAGATETVTFAHGFDAAGTYDVSVDDTDAGTVTVDAADDGGDGDGGDDAIPGFGAGVALASLLTAVAAARYRAR